MAQPTRFGRIPRQKVIWEASEVLNPSAKAKKGKKRQFQVLETRAASPNAPPVVHQLVNEPQVDFIPPIQVDSEPFYIRWIERDPLSLFLRFFGGFTCLEIVCVATNARAESQVSATLQTRSWIPIQPIDLLRWLGLLFYMADHKENNRQTYWQVSKRGETHNLGRWMSRNRWERIHRFLTFNDTPINQKDSFRAPIEPIASVIRANCQDAVKPSTWFAVDEAMAPFTGRSKHKVNLPSKPTPEGYKVWVLALQRGYIWSWRWHSRINGPEAIGKTTRFFTQPVGMPLISLAPTYQVVQSLCQELQNKDSTAKKIVFLDSLFLTTALAHTLLYIGIGVMGTTRKNHKEFPQRFIDAKLSDSQFTYGSCSTEVIDHCLCFLWQDNAPVMGISTAFSIREGPQDYVIRTRKRPSNNAVAAPVFGDKSTKELPIPKAIDAYNHNHNLVDLADQLRGNFTCQRQWESRTWRPLAYWLIDTCLVNSYLIWQSLQPQNVLQEHRSHRVFRDILISQIFDYQEPSPTPPISPARTRSTTNHVSTEMPKRGFCAWNKRNGGDCCGAPVVALRRERKALNEISGNARDKRARARPRLTKFGCNLCGVHLCRETGCFTKFHANPPSN